MPGASKLQQVIQSGDDGMTKITSDELDRRSYAQRIPEMIETMDAMDAVIFARFDTGIAAGFHEPVHGVERAGGWMFSLGSQTKHIAVCSLLCALARRPVS